MSRSGGTGRRPGLKIPWVVIPVPVRFRSAAFFSGITDQVSALTDNLHGSDLILKEQYKCFSEADLKYFGQGLRELVLFDCKTGHKVKMG